MMTSFVISRTIVQVVAHNMNMKIRRGQTDNLIEQKLLEKINDENLHSKIDEILLSLVSSGNANDNIRFKYKEEWKECISTSNCSKVDQLLLELGNKTV